MGSDVAVISDNNPTDVLRLCEIYMVLNGKRANLDQRLIALAETDREQSCLWQQLEIVGTELSHAVGRLATTQATDLLGLRAKASVLALLLQACRADPAALSAEVVALALSVADEVPRLI